VIAAHNLIRQTIDCRPKAQATIAVLARLPAQIPQNRSYLMVTTPRNALHDVHTATNDVLTGYETMLDRAEPEIVPIIADLTTLHRKHAIDLEDRLHQLGEDGKGDKSLQGTLNSVAVTLRDWVTGLDKGTLDAVERGEKALRDVYADALSGLSAADDPLTAALLTAQHQDIDKALSTLTRH
jgi:hypothetical protein